MTDNKNSWQQAVAWIEAEMGGVVLNAKPQGRWRSAWFLTGSVVSSKYCCIFAACGLAWAARVRRCGWK